MHDSKPILGVIMMGGKSTRMGFPKATLDFHGLPQWKYLSHLLAKLNLACCLSLREEQLALVHSSLAYVVDSGTKGPIEGLAMAQAKYPKHALLTLACDMPFVDEGLLNLLIKHRNPEKDGTFFLNSERHAPEPLLGIWENSTSRMIQEAIEKESYSLMNILDRISLTFIEGLPNRTFTNINRPEELKKFKESREDR